MSPGAQFAVAPDNTRSGGHATVPLLLDEQRGDVMKAPDEVSAMRIVNTDSGRS